MLKLHKKYKKYSSKYWKYLEKTRNQKNIKISVSWAQNPRAGTLVPEVQEIEILVFFVFFVLSMFQYLELYFLIIIHYMITFVNILLKNILQIDKITFWFLPLHLKANSNVSLSTLVLKINSRYKVFFHCENTTLRFSITND